MYTNISNKTIYILIGSLLIFPMMSYFLFKHKKIQKLIFGLIAYLKYTGNKSIKGKLYYISIVIIMNIVFMNSTIPNLMSGYIFGLRKGILLTLIGCIISGVISFYMSRYILKDKILEKVNKNEVLSQIKKDEKLLEKNDWFELTTLSRLPPTYPYHLTSYFWGITDISVFIFIIGSIIGILPGLSLETYIGYKFSNIKDIFKSKHNIFVTIGGIIVTIIVSFIIGLKAEEILKNKVKKNKVKKNKT
jgi:uncharacterized membrane protein YdjX (TVP38/TMEM64 family)